MTRLRKLMKLIIDGIESKFILWQYKARQNPLHLNVVVSEGDLCLIIVILTDDGPADSKLITNPSPKSEFGLGAQG